MNPALPVLFRCDARKLQFTKPKCAEDYYLANGGAVGAEQKATAAALTECRKCPIGAKHREEAAGAFVEGGRLVGDVGTIPTPERAPAAEKQLAKERREEAREREREARKTNVVVPIRAAQSPAPAHGTTPKEIEMEKKECVNPDCGKLFVPKRSDALTCSKSCSKKVSNLKYTGKWKASGTNAATPPKAAPARKTARAKVASSPGTVIAYLELLHQVDRFEVEYPEVVEEANRIRELVGAPREA